MNRVECLEAARQAVAERGGQYGRPEDLFRVIAKLWEPLVGKPITPELVALMMVQLKVARAAANPDHSDSWADGAGYFACGAEVATASRSARIVSLSRSLTDPRRDEDDGA